MSGRPDILYLSLSLSIPLNKNKIGNKYLRAETMPHEFLTFNNDLKLVVLCRAYNL